MDELACHNFLQLQKQTSVFILDKYNNLQELDQKQIMINISWNDPQTWFL